MKILPTTLNHNAFISSLALSDAVKDHKELSNKVQEIQQKALNQEYKKPIQVQADAMEMYPLASDKTSSDTIKGIKLLSDSAELTSKLPIFDTKQMAKDGVPKKLIEKAEMVNHNLKHGLDPDSMKQKAEMESQTSQNQAVAESNAGSAGAQSVAGVMGGEHGIS